MHVVWITAFVTVAGLVWLYFFRKRHYGFEDVRTDIMPLSPQTDFHLQQLYRVDRSDHDPDRLRVLLREQMWSNLRGLPPDVESMPETLQIVVDPVSRLSGGRREYSGYATIRLRQRRS